MAYKVKVKEYRCDDLEIELADGTVKTYHPRISADTVVKEYREFIKKVNKLEAGGIDNYDGDYYEDLGFVVVQFLAMLFGKEQVQDMVEAFQGRYVDLFSTVMPYINDVVTPLANDVNNDRINHYNEIINEAV